jgi:hypothetical protein
VTYADTYEIFAAHWPKAPVDQQVLAKPLNTLPKYVASTTLDEPLGWQNSRLLRGDIGAAVRALKAGLSEQERLEGDVHGR